MSEKRSSLGSRADNNNSTVPPRTNKRRRTMLDSVAEVAKWLLPSWASEHEAAGQTPAGARISSNDEPSGSGVPTGLHGRYTSSFRNGERNLKRARFNTDLPHAATRREIIGRLSPVTPASSPPALADDVCDLDDGSDSSTSGCSSLSFAGLNVPTSSGVSIPVEEIDHQPNDRLKSLNRQVSVHIASGEPVLQRATPCAGNGKAKDISNAAKLSSTVGETSASGAGSFNFSLFPRSSRAHSSTLNTTLPPVTGTQSRLLSSSLHKPERSLNRSIFYDGKTTYGGAAAHRKLNLFSPSPYQMSATRNKAITNVRVQGQNSTAKRLIQALERINTPVQNAKRIPMGRPESAASQDSELRRKEALETIASFRQNMPPALSTCRTTVENAKIGSNVASAAQHAYTIDLDSDKTSVPPTTPSLSLVTSTPSSHHRTLKIPDTLSVDKGGGKMKSIKSIYSSRKTTSLIAEEEPAPPAPELCTAAPLPIKTLPSFSFATKPVTSSVVVSSAQDLAPKGASVRSPLTSLADFSNKPFEKTSVPLVCPSADSPEVFTFSGPVSLAKPVGPAMTKEEEFKFKHPLYLNKNGNTNIVNKMPAFTVTAPTMIVSNPGSLKVKEISKVFAPSSELSTSGSVLDALGSIAKDDKMATGSLGSNDFHSTSGRWDCQKCTVTNESSDDKCKVCEFKKLESILVNTQSVVPVSSTHNQWGDFLNKSSGQWMCETCTTPNKAEQMSCAACSEPKTGFKSGASEKSEGAPAVNSFKFGLPSASATTEKSDKKGNERKEESTSNFFSTAKDAGSPVSFGTSQNTLTSTASTGTPFKFGASSSESKPAESAEPLKNATPTPATALFSFGESPTTTAPPASTFTFGNSAIPSGISAPSAATFSFGTAAVLSTATSSTTPTLTTFSFGTPSAIMSPPSNDNVKLPTSDVSAFTTFGSSGTLFGACSLTATMTTKTPTASLQLFGPSTSTATATTTASLPTAKSSSFSFTTTSNTSAMTTQTSTFATPEKTETSKPLFNFGGTTPSTTTTLASSGAATPAPSSESAIAKTTTLASTPSPFAFSLTTNSNSSTTAPAPSASTGYNFGAAVNNTAPTLFSFGQRSAGPPQVAATSSTSGGFGTPAATTVHPTTANTFGALAASSPTQSTAPQFGTGPVASSGIFHFGATSPATSPPVMATSTVTPSGAPAFVFGQPNAASRASGNTASSGQPTIFSFGTNSGTTSAASTTGVNPNSPAPAFGFGPGPTMTSTQASATGGDMFKFVNPSAPPSAAPTFQFGQQQPVPTAGPCPFQFSAVGNSASPLVPSFMGTPTIENPFSAPLMTGRRVKRAVRRKPGPR
ncbi:hypothetical protein BIW11_05931 [Tropilaelaps mercedesae]|uniref:RanBP2-type domain-containing protein n=1 Tax=Tropilaelaps mercedesae TaxID=418985 RepID=A0A1V9Y0M1_9ACAR|nr:hypothetical protein BIW11_05931 [Tropilaelaps mercedesae]